MSDKIRILLIDDVNDYISYPVLHADELVVFHIDSWAKAQLMLSAQTESLDPDIILIDINFQEDQSAPRWRPSEGEPDYGDRKPTGLFIGLAFSGLLYQSGLPRIGSIYSADPGLFRGDPAARTAAALLDMAINRSNRLWTQVSIDNWFDSFNLGSDPHHACRAAIVKLREKIVDWCQGSMDARLAVTPSSHGRAGRALTAIKGPADIAARRDALTLDFITAAGTIRKLNLCSLFAECDLAISVEQAQAFLDQIGYFPALLAECVQYAEKVDKGARLTAIVPDSKPLQRLAVVILLLLKWWQQQPERWRLELNYAWDLDNGCPAVKPAVSLKVYLKRLAQALGDFHEIDFADLHNSAHYIEAHLLIKSQQYAIFNRKVLGDLLPMLLKAGALKHTADSRYRVLAEKVEREQRIDAWRPEANGIKFLQQEFLDSLQMQTNQFQRIIQEANRACRLSLPIYWDNNWKGNGEFQLPCSLRVLFQDYARSHMHWHKEDQWPGWLR